MQAAFFLILFFTLAPSFANEKPLKKGAFSEVKTVAKGCFLELIEFTKGESAWERRKRGKFLAEKYQEGNINEFSRVLWASINVNGSSYSFSPMKIKGRNPELESVIRELTRFHGSFMPAHYHKSINGGDTLSLAYRIADEEIKFSSQEAGAVQEMRDMLKDIEQFPHEFNTAIKRVFENQVIALHMKNNIFNPKSGKYLSRSMAEKMPKEERYFSSPIILYNETTMEFEYSMQRVPFDSYEDLLDLYREYKRKADNYRSDNIRDEFFFKGLINNVRMKHAYLWRRAELIYTRLKHIDDRKLHQEQIRIKYELANFFNDTQLVDIDQDLWKEFYAKLVPEPNFIEELQRRELRSALFAAFRFWRPKHVTKEAKYLFNGEILPEAKKINLFGKLFRYLGFGTVIGLGTYTAYLVSPIGEWVPLQFSVASVNNHIHDFFESVPPFKGSYYTSRCKGIQRNWVLYDQSIVNDIVESHLSRFRIKMLLDKSYDIATDEHYQKRRAEIIVKCLEARARWNESIVHYDNKRFTQEFGFRMVVDNAFLDFVQDKYEHSLSNKILAQVEEAVKEATTNKDEEKAKHIAYALQKSSPQLAADLLLYLELAKEGQKFMDERGTTPRAVSLDDFLHKLKELKRSDDPQNIEKINQDDEKKGKGNSKGIIGKAIQSIRSAK